jgi:hypothetical protein
MFTTWTQAGAAYTGAAYTGADLVARRIRIAGDTHNLDLGIASECVADGAARLPRMTRAIIEAAQRESEESGGSRPTSQRRAEEAEFRIDAIRLRTFPAAIELGIDRITERYGNRR